MEIVRSWQQELQSAAKPEKIEILSSFFKCGAGEYGEGDVFIGLSVPDNRRLSEKYWDAPMAAIDDMLSHRIHEFRLGGLLALVKRYSKTRSNDERRAIVIYYIEQSANINNWDLVDLSCYKILGDYQLRTGVDILSPLADSENMWVQRMAIVGTMALVRKGRFDVTLQLAERYLSHRHDLIHKATGWLLREVGKKEVAVLLGFLDAHAREMPRTALRYAIEKLDKRQQRRYLGK